MELYLDSADLDEIKEAFNLGFIKGLTTTPTFMHRHGVTDIDGAREEVLAGKTQLNFQRLSLSYRSKHLAIQPKK